MPLPPDIDPVDLELMRNLYEAAAEEMGIVLQRVAFSARRNVGGPLLLVDPEATTYVPPGWTAAARMDGIVHLTKVA